MEEKQYYKEKRISSSSLKYFDQSPLTFKRFLDQEIEQEEKSYLTRGKQIHMAILEPELFRKNYTHLKFETPKSEQQKQFCENYVLYLSDSGISDHGILLEEDALRKAYMENYKSAKNDPITEAKTLKDKLAKYIEYLQKRKQYKDILSTTDWDRIQDLKEGCKKHKKANELLFEDELSTRKVYNELVIFWEDPLHKLPCKSMIDRLIVDDDNKKVILIDLKTANTFNEFKERCNEFKYFRQMSFYWYAINWYFINTLNKDISQYTKETYIIALKTVDDPEVKVYSINERYLMDGFVDMTEALSLIAWHWENEKWDYTRAYYIGDGEEKL